MKQTTQNGTPDVLHKLEIIEEEISDLKWSVLKKLTPSKKNLASLKGILKGVDISEADIEGARKSLYGKTAI